MNKPWSAILNNNTDVLVVADCKSLSALGWNDPFIKHFQLDGAEVPGKNVFMLSGQKNWKQKTARTIGALTKNSFHQENQPGDRNHFFFHWVRSGKSEFVLCRVVNVEESKTQRQYKDLFEKNVAGVYKINSRGIIIACNQAFSHMLGFPDPTELIGSKAEKHYLHPTIRKSFLESIRGNAIVTNYEIEVRRKDGTECTCLENAFLEMDESGHEIISGTLIDISEKKRIEGALRESEERFRMMANVTLEAVAFVAQSIIIDSNDQFAKLFGYNNRAEVVAKRITEFVTETDLKRIRTTLDIAGANRIEVRTEKRDTTPLYLEVTGGFIDYHSIRTKALLFYDITARKRAEFALEQSALRFKNLLENSPNAVLILTDGKMKYMNQAAITLLGFEDEDDVFDKKFIQFIPTRFRREIGEDLRRVREGDEIDYKEIKLCDRHGTEVDIGIKSTLTVFENKPSIQVTVNNLSTRMQLIQEQYRLKAAQEMNVALVREIERHKETQAKLMSAQNYTRNIIESSIDMIIACDRKSRITEFNTAAAQQFGYSIKEVKAKHVSMLFSKREEWEKLDKALSNAGSFSGEVINVKKNGQKFSSLLSASLIKNAGGEVMGSMGVSRDITEYRANERKALEQKAKLESIFNSTENLMMWTVNNSGRITSMNANFYEWMRDFYKEQLHPGHDIMRILKKHVDPDFYQGQLEAFANAFKGRPQQFEFALRNVSGKTVWLQAFLNPVYMEDKLEEVSCLVYDNTDRKEMDRRILDSLKEKEVLLQEVHHRVKNNLQVISSILNLQSSYVNDERTLDILRESQQRIKSMSFIHETLYRTSDFSSIDFSEYMQALSSNLFQSYKTQSASVSMVTDFGPVHLSIDQAMPCGLIVNELVSNALKYAYKGKKKGKLWISIREEGKKITLRVADDGVGLPKDFGYAEHDSLGVQLVYTLIEQLDGTIDIVSKKGTEIKITFEKNG